MSTQKGSFTKQDIRSVVLNLGSVSHSQVFDGGQDMSMMNTLMKWLNFSRARFNSNSSTFIKIILLAKNIPEILIPFATVYLCEQSFSRMINMKMNRLYCENRRVALVKVKLCISELVSERQHQRSHWLAVNIHYDFGFCMKVMFCWLCSLNIMILCAWFICVLIKYISRYWRNYILFFQLRMVWWMHRWNMWLFSTSNKVKNHCITCIGCSPWWDWPQFWYGGCCSDWERAVHGDEDVWKVL